MPGNLALPPVFDGQFPGKPVNLVTYRELTCVTWGDLNYGASFGRTFNSVGTAMPKVVEARRLTVSSSRRYRAYEVPDM